MAYASPNYDKGETPITKNIRVVDAAGNEYEATYPKRAKGLVKNGRAIFIDEFTLCLDCPPSDYLEDKSMDNSINSNINQTEQNVNSVTAPEMTLEWVAAKIDAIINDNAYIADAISSLNLMDSDGHNSKAEALHQVVNAREATNRETLKFLEKIYDGLNPAPAANPSQIMQHIDLAELAEHMNSTDLVELMKAIVRP